MAASLILRTVKGTPLTNLEVDNNFSNLSVYSNTIDANVGLLSSLTTTDTSNIVAAVNSIKSGNLRQFATTTSADLISVLSDETGTGSAVFGTGPTISLPVINNIKQGYTSTATAAGTTTLTSASNFYQRFTGSTTQTVVLPVTSTLAEGVAYEIENASTGNLTVNSSGGNLVATVIPGVTVQCRCIGTTLTTAADWDPEYNEFATITGTGSNVLSADPTISGTLTSSGQLTTKKIVETVVAIGNTGTAANIDLSQGTVFTATLNGNATLTITNPGTVSSFTLILTNDGTGGRSLAFAGGTFLYPGGAANLARTTTANAVDFWFFMTANGGTTWYGSQPIKDAKA